MKRITVLFILSVVFLSACASSKWVRQPVVQQHEFVVSLEQHQENGGTVQQKYQHPYKLDLAVLEKLLGDLTYSETFGLMNEKRKSPVFQTVEIHRLAPVLAKTLSKADPGQRIRFASFNNEEALIFSISRKTEGVIFIEPNGQLNIAFNFINSDRHAGETSAFQYNYSTSDPLKIKTSDTPISATAPYIVLHKFETGKIAPMWVEADLDRLKESANTETNSTVRTIEEIPPAVAPKTKDLDTPVEKTAPPQASGDVLEDIKNKLKYLKELLNEGLISEKDYNAKKMELLDKIN